MRCGFFTIKLRSWCTCLALISAIFAFILLHLGDQENQSHIWNAPELALLGLGELLMAEWLLVSLASEKVGLVSLYLFYCFIRFALCCLFALKYMATAIASHEMLHRIVPDFIFILISLWYFACCGLTVYGYRRKLIDEKISSADEVEHYPRVVYLQQSPHFSSVHDDSPPPAYEYCVNSDRDDPSPVALIVSASVDPFTFSNSATSSNQENSSLPPPYEALSDLVSVEGK